MSVALVLQDIPGPRQQNLELPKVVPIKLIRAHSIAHLEIGAGERAILAAEWVDGVTTVSPTVKLAAHTFMVSEQLVARAIKDARRRNYSASMPLGMLVFGWRMSSEAERSAFVAEHEVEIWTALEHVTDFQR